jgi:hypothetical protein
MIAGVGRGMASLRVVAHASAALLAVVTGCGGDAGDAPDDPSAPASDAACVQPATDSGEGTGTLVGSPDGNPFGGVASSLWISSPDDPATTVVFLFSAPVGCGALCAAGWDQRIADGTRVLELKMFGLNGGSFGVVTSPTPAPGESAVNYTLSSTTTTPVEVGASSGTVTLGAIEVASRATGSFSVTFAAGAITGDYDAHYCPGGHEP